jgi:hypothetical protein
VTFIVTIDPVKGLSLLDVLTHSLNLQTRKNFDVVFYNQTPLDDREVFDRLRIEPAFDYRVIGVDRREFFGDFPLWDLYSLHRQVLERDLVGDYFMALHMEEFLDVDYVEKVTEVLERTGFDVLLGNLCRTGVDGDQIADIVRARTARDVDTYLCARGLKAAPRWACRSPAGSSPAKRGAPEEDVGAAAGVGGRLRPDPGEPGYVKLRVYHEDVYLMSKAFARQYGWFLPGRRMYFEDVHLCEKPGVCELAAEIAKLTDFPNYFDRSRVYHIDHRKFYYQLEDPAFTESLLALDTDDVILRTLQRAIRMYRGGSVTLKDALRYTRRNAEGTGTQNLNYKYHMQAIREARRSARGLA